MKLKLWYCVHSAKCGTVDPAKPKSMQNCRCNSETKMRIVRWLAIYYILLQLIYKFFCWSPCYRHFILLIHGKRGQCCYIVISFLLPLDILLKNWNIPKQLSRLNHHSLIFFRLSDFFGITGCGTQICTAPEICFYQKIHNFYSIIMKFG